MSCNAHEAPILKHYTYAIVIIDNHLTLIKIGPTQMVIYTPKSRVNWDYNVFMVGMGKQEPILGDILRVT